MTQLEQLTGHHPLPETDSLASHGERQDATFASGHNVAGETSLLRDDDDDDVVGWFDWVAENAALVQTWTLRRIIELNRGTEYLGRWLGEDLGGVEGLGPGDELEELYTSLVPLSSHLDLEPYIQRIADGDTRPILTRDPITTLSLSSGTTDGRPKYLPFTRFSARSTLRLFKLAAAHRARAFPIGAGGRILEFIYSSQQFQTRGGLTVGTATTHYYASEEFGIKQRSTECFTCSPREVISGGDYKQSTYCHLLLGLVHRDRVEFVTSTFAYSIVQALAALEELWQEICDDIGAGGLSHARVTAPAVRRAVLQELAVPDPGLASRIEAECRDLRAAGWRGVIPALWPGAKYVYSIMTGSMLPYLKKLRHYAGGLPLVGADYGSTESWIGVNLEPSNPPENVTFTVIPTFSYFEFIPLRRRAQQQQQLENQLGWEDGMALPPTTDYDFVEDAPVPLSQVKVGHEYELVLTTFTGLYRYRLGDVVEVTGFYKAAPQLSFVCRRKLILTVNIDKNTEKDLQLAVERGSRPLAHTRAELVDFTSHAVVVGEGGQRPGHYVVYWEVKGEAGDAVLQECCREMDLAFSDHGYVVSRRCGSIGPLELRVLEGGTFKKVLDYYIGNGAAMSQFKTPRCTSNPVLLRILDRCTVRRFWSTAYAA